MPYASDSLPRYAILFDMVGGVGAKFHREFFSDSEASQLVDKVRSVAERSGFGDRFINKTADPWSMTISSSTKPASRQLISSRPKTTRQGRLPRPHTANDNLDNIDPSAMQAAGRTVLNLLHNEIQCVQ